jgi:hypothetical protein
MEMTSLLRLLIRNTRHCASDPRDHVYALLGLAYDGGASELDPRYDQTVAETYIQTCRYLVSKNEVEFLHATGAPQRDTRSSFMGSGLVGTQTRHLALQKHL